MTHPDCPKCDTDVFVTGRKGRPSGEFQCEFCGWIKGGDIAV